MRRLIIALVAASLLASSATGVALGQGKGRSGLGLVLLESTDGVPHWGQQVTFDVETGRTDSPMVHVGCAQGETIVYDALAGFTVGAESGPTYTLASESWQGGEADCDARMYTYHRNGREWTLASLSFHVHA